MTSDARLSVGFRVFARIEILSHGAPSARKQLVAYYRRGKTRPQQTGVERAHELQGVGRFLPAQAPLQALAHQHPLVPLGGEDRGQGCFDELVGQALLPQLAGDAVAAEAAVLGAGASVAESEAAVVEPAAVGQPLDERRDFGRGERAPFQFLAEFSRGVRAAGQGAQGVVFEPLPGQAGRWAAGRARPLSRARARSRASPAAFPRGRRRRWSGCPARAA